MTPAEHREGEARGQRWRIRHIRKDAPQIEGRFTDWIEVVPADDKRAMERDIVEQEEGFSRARAVAEERERVLVEAIEEHRGEKSHGLTGNMEWADQKLYAALDSVQEGERS